MFRPNLNITNKTARYLTEIAEARAIIFNAPLIPKWEIDLRRQALIKSTHASTSIEGNKLSLEEVSDLMVGRKITATLKDKKAVGGAGACEIALARELRKFSLTLSGREKLAVDAFADAIEIIPETLAENAGYDPIDSLTEMKSQHEQGRKWSGLDAFTGNCLDSWKQGIVEPLRIKIQAIQSASEVAEMILRIDDVLASGKEQRPSMEGI